MNQRQLTALVGRRRRSDDDMVLPLINIVFLLLIFFMLAGQFTTRDAFSITPAQSESKADGSDRAPVVLIGPNGRLAVGADPMASLDQLSNALQRNNSDADMRRITVKADQRAPADRLIRVMERLQQAGADDIELVTRRRP